MHSSVWLAGMQVRYISRLPEFLFKIAQSTRRRKGRAGETQQSPSELYSQVVILASWGPLGVFTADSSDHRQQSAGCFVLGNEGIHHIQGLFWNLVVT
jgi:hypothetical protein